MKILVLVKIVPLPESSFRVNSKKDGYETSGLAFAPNEYDLNAMEEAVRIKERVKGSEVTGITVGPEWVEKQFRRALAVGADEGYRIEAGEGAEHDPVAVASLVAGFAGPRKFDLILCGVMSSDYGRGQVGPMLAAKLGMPWATTAVKCEICDDASRVNVERELEGGVREKVSLAPPCLLTAQSGLNIPRYPTLTNVLRIQDLEIPVIKAAGEGSDLSVSLRPPPPAKCEMVTGSPQEIAEALLAGIRSRVKVW